MALVKELPQGQAAVAVDRIILWNERSITQRLNWEEFLKSAFNRMGVLFEFSGKFKM